MRHVRTIKDLTPPDVERLVQQGLALKHEHARDRQRQCQRLPGRVLGLLFEKPSLRTRVSFEVAMAHLGGSSIFLSAQEVGLGKRESVADVARVLTSYVDVLALRTYSHALVEEFAAHAMCPVINALSDMSHPCQALGDLCTIQEHFGRLAGLRLVYVGDGNNVARSLAHAAAYTGVEFVLCAPEDYALPAAEFARNGSSNGVGKWSFEPDPRRAVAEADVVYTDVWASMGQESEAERRRLAFANYQVNAELMARAKPTARFLHCMPAHRGEEVTADVIDGPASLVVAQANHRLHAQKALLLDLLS